MAGVIDRSVCILQMFIPALFYIIKTQFLYRSV